MLVSSTLTPVFHQSLIWRLTMNVSLLTAHLYALTYLPNYYIIRRPLHRSKCDSIVLCVVVATRRVLRNYHAQIGLCLLSTRCTPTDVPREVLCCGRPNCNDEAHRSLLCKLHNDIMPPPEGAAEAIPTKTNNTSPKARHAFASYSVANMSATA